MRKITIEDAKIKSLMDQKTELVNRGQEIQKEVEKMNEELNKIYLKINRINTKAQPLFSKHTDAVKIEEFEEISKISSEGDTLVLEIVDVIEDFKEAYRAKKAELLKKQEELEKKDGPDQTSDSTEKPTEGTQE